MSKDRLYNRLEELFSTNTSSIPVIEQAQQAMRAAPPAAPHPVAEQIVEPPVQEFRQRLSWQDFLDGIRRRHMFGYLYDSGEVRPLESFSTQPERTSQAYPLSAGGEVFGQLVVETTDDPTWSAMQKAVASAVAQRLSQQVDNLRLLDEAERYRVEAEQALARLTQKGWQEFLVAEEDHGMAFVYDQNQVKPGVDEDDFAEADLAVPLAVRNQVLGEVKLSGISELSTEAQNLLAAVTQQLSSHLDNLRLSEQREVALAEVEALYEISAELSAATTLQEALMAVSRPAIASGAKRASLLRIVADKQAGLEEAELVAHWQKETSAGVTPLGMRFNLAEMPDYASWINNPDEPFMLSDAASMISRSAGGMQTPPDFKGLLVLPLNTPEALIGIIVVHWDEERHFSSADERLYRALAQQTAVVVNNLLLFEQAKRRAADMETVSTISTEISRLLDPDSLLRTVVNETYSGFNLYHVQIYLYNEDENSLVLSAGSGEVGALLVENGHSIPVSEAHSLVAGAARTRQEVIVGDTSKEADFLPNALLPDTRSELVLPMIVGNRLLGVFDVQDSRFNRFSQIERQIFLTLTSQVAVALQNARLYLEQAETVQRLRELDHLKSDFLANMSHELRTPLNSIMGFTDVILLGLDGPLTDQMENDLKLVEKNGKHLLSLINNVLDMSKIEAGRMTLSLEKFDLRSLMDETMDIVSPLAREKSLDLRLAIQNDEDIEMLADRVRMRQVMINILGNAVKFTETGEIMIAVSLPQPELVRIAVSDTGLGIPPNKLDMVFESFSQIDTSSTRKVGGTGLGLPISRSLVEMHGGRLWAESTGIAGEGSTFIIEMPLKAG